MAYHAIKPTQQEVIKLSPQDRLALVDAIMESLSERPVSQSDRSAAINRMRGLLTTDRPALTDEEVAVMLDRRRTEKYS